MAYFDFLIDKENKAPIEGMEYIYNLDMVWAKGKLGSISIKKGIIVTNVKKMENNGYEFTVKETGEIFKSNYGWAFWENTPENLKEIKKYEEIYLEYEKWEKAKDKALSNISKLK